MLIHYTIHILKYYVIVQPSTLYVRPNPGQDRYKLGIRRSAEGKAVAIHDISKMINSLIS